MLTINKERRTRPSSHTGLLLLLMAFTLVGISYSESGQAQAEPDGREKRRVAQVPSNAGYRKLNEAQEALNSDEQAEAIAALDEIVSGSRYSAYDKAKALQMRAFIHVNNDDYPRAIADNRRALDLQSLDLNSERELLYTLANLYAFAEDYELSIQFLERWFAQTENPDAQAYFTAAQIYALAEQVERALNFAEQGMQLHRSDAAAAPRETWYRLLLAIRLQMKDYHRAAILLEEILGHWPDKAEYHRQLSGLYLELGREVDALATLSIARQNGLLKREEEFERLLQMYRYHEYPFKGSSIFAAFLANNGEPSSEDLKLLGDGYSQSREWQQANRAYLQAAERSSDGRIWLLLCQTAYRDGLWQQVKAHCARSLESGGLDDDQGQAWQMLAMARYHENERTAAMEAFEHCTTTEPVAGTCSQWLAHLEKQVEREAAEERRRRKEEEQATQRQEDLQEAVEGALYFQ